MANSGFTIAIRATDNASAQIDAINKRFEAMHKQVAMAMAPLTRLRASMAKFLELTGIDRLTTGFTRLAQGAYSVFQQLLRIVEPLAAITGAASLAGMYRMVSAWSDFGQKLGFSSARIGIAADRLQDLQGAAQLAGSSSEAMTAGLTHLTDEINAAVGGRSPEAIAMFQMLHVSFQNADLSARSAAEVFPELQAKIAAMHDPANQARLAMMGFGGAGADLLPVLRMNRDEFEKLAVEARRHAHITNDSVRVSKEFEHGQWALTQSVKGFGDAIAEQLAPIITPLLTQMSDWLDANREWIAQDIGGYVKEFATYLRSVNWSEVGTGIVSVFRHAEDLVKKLWEWRGVLENISILVAGLFVARFIGSFGVINTRLLGLIGLAGVAFDAFNRIGRPIDGSRLPTESPLRLPGDAPMRDEDRTWWNQPLNFGRAFEGLLPGLMRPGSPTGDGPGAVAPPHLTGPEQSGAQQQAMQQLIALGRTPEQAAGMVANMDGESDMRPGLPGDNGEAYGLAQWHRDRQELFRRHTGHDIRGSSLAEQTEFMNWEIDQGDPQTREVGRRFQDGTQTPEQAADIDTRFGERPANPDRDSADRQIRARRIYNDYLRAQGTRPPPGALAAPPTASPGPITPPPPPQRSPVSYRIGNGDGTQTATQAAERLAGRADLVVRFANPPAGLSSSLNVTGNLWGRGPRVEMGLPQQSRT